MNFRILLCVTALFALGAVPAASRGIWVDPSGVAEAGTPDRGVWVDPSGLVEAGTPDRGVWVDPSGLTAERV